MTQRLTRAQRHTVGELVQYLGVEPGVRRSAGDIAERLPAGQRCSAEVWDIVAKKMSALEVFGLVEQVKHPFGGWALTEAGAALIRQDIEDAQAALNSVSSTTGTQS